MNEQLCPIIDPLMELTQAHKAVNIQDLPGAWECKIDDAWYVACNGHDEAISVSPPDAMAIDVPPYHFAVWYNGWLAGLFHPYGGEFAAGTAANEEAFTAAVRQSISSKGKG